MVAVGLHVRFVHVVACLPAVICQKLFEARQIQPTDQQPTDQPTSTYKLLINMQIKYYNIIILLFALSCWMLAAYMVVLYANMRMHIIFDDYSIIHSLPNS